MMAHSAREDRQGIWRGAEWLGAVAAPDDLPARYQAWGEDVCPTIFDLHDIVEAAQWPLSRSDDLSLFLRCVGAAGMASAWRTIVDGESLRRLAEIVSEPLLDAALAIDPLRLPGPGEGVGDPLDRRALAELGRRLLLASLPGAFRRNEPFCPAQARLAVDAAATLFRQVRGVDA